MRMRALAGLSVGLAVIFSTLQARATELTTMRVASGLSRPLFATSPPGDYERLFIVEQWTARIKILRDGQILPTPFLDIDSLVINSGSERGLLGLAFHPDYQNNGYFYVNYNNNSGATVIARFQVSENPDVADANSRFTVMTIPQPFSNHNGGMLAFGPFDGYLYIGTGDGGSANDPGNRAQDDGELLGKMLRIDVDGGDPYGIPPDNPFAGPGLPLDEIWAKGLRNPWRYCFDRTTGDLYIADVGQNAWEEVDFQPASSSGGENYGWRCMEGNHCTGLSGCTCNDPSLTLPIHEYSHGFGCSITGGYVYRGNVIPDLRGSYFFADFCSDRIWSFRYDGENLTDFQERTAELDPAGFTINSISSFGEDGSGEIYIVDLGGEVFKIIPSNPGSVSGTVTNQAGQEVEGVYARVEGTVIDDSTDSSGQYQLSGLGGGTFAVSFSHPAYRDTVVTDVTVLEGETTTLDVTLTTGGNTPPFSFPLIEPVDSATVVDYDTDFIWGNTSDPDSGSSFEFFLQISDDTLFGQPIFSFNIGVDTTWIVITDSLFSHGQNLFWRVLAIDNDSLVTPGGIPEPESRYLFIIPPGDANSNGEVNVVDITFLVNYLTGAGPAPDPFFAGDANGNCELNVVDVTFLVNYLTGSGPQPQRADCI